MSAEIYELKGHSEPYLLCVYEDHLTLRVIDEDGGIKNIVYEREISYDDISKLKYSDGKLFSNKHIQFEYLDRMVMTSKKVSVDARDNGRKIEEVYKYIKEKVDGKIHYDVAYDTKKSTSVLYFLGGKNGYYQLMVFEDHIAILKVLHRGFDCQILSIFALVSYDLISNFNVGGGTLTTPSIELRYNDALSGRTEFVTVGTAESSENEFRDAATFITSKIDAGVHCYGGMPEIEQKVYQYVSKRIEDENEKYGIKPVTPEIQKNPTVDIPCFSKEDITSVININGVYTYTNLHKETLHLYPDKCVKDTTNCSKHFGGYKLEFYYDNLTSIDLLEGKGSGLFDPTILTFHYAGNSHDYTTIGGAGKHLGLGLTFASENEKDQFKFWNTDIPIAMAIRDYISEGIRNSKKAVSTTVIESAPAPLSAADEIKKFAELRDSGIITEDEFQQKKKQLLGL